MINRIRIITIWSILLAGGIIPTAEAAEIAHWTMNENKGSVIADLVGGHNASIHGASWTMGALKLDGIDDYADCENATAFNLRKSFTLEAWINPVRTANDQAIISKSGKESFQYSLSLDKGRLQGKVQFADGPKIVTGSTTLATGEWHHVFLVYDGQGIRLFLNGNMDGSIDAEGDIPSGTSPLSLGKGYPPSACFHGMIDEVRIFDHAMTATEIQAENYPYRQWDFFYWSLLPGFTHATGGMVKTLNEVAFWRKRGVRPFHWKGGRCQYSASFNRISAYLEYWGNKYPQWPGIAIDEFSGKNDTIDQLLGDSLIAVRERYPHLYLAPYCIGISAPRVIDGLKKTDKIQLETYLSSSRGNYKTITTRYQKAIEHQLTNITLLTLGINRDWITTPAELRRQLHFIRYHYPDMGGVGIYNSNPDYNKYLLADLNNLLQEFYSNPVLRMEPLANGKIVVRNIGSRRSDAAEIRIETGDKELSRKIPPLESGAAFSLEAPGNAIPVTEFTPGCFKLGPPMLYAEEPLRYRPGADKDWPTAGAPAETFACDFSTNPIERTEQDGSFIKTAYCPARNTAGRNFEMSFDLQINQTAHYGSIEVGLSSSGDASSILLNIYRGDGEPSPRMTILATDSTGLLTREEIAVNLAQALYRVKIHYSTHGHIRAALLDKAGKTLWDTGEFPVYNPIGLDRLQFGVRPSPNSLLQWDAAEQKLRLRGAASPAYILDAHIDNLKIGIWN